MRHRRTTETRICQAGYIDGVLRILVGSVLWDGPAHATPSWSVVRELPGESSVSVVDDAIAALLTSTDYFAICAECGERKPKSWMDDERICQTCAERRHGVVY